MSNMVEVVENMANPLHPDLLCRAYSMGYFPMPDPQTGEIVFLRPDPRAILPLNGFHCSRSLHRFLQKGVFEISMNHAFKKVMLECSNREDTWITGDFLKAYSQLHKMGVAHSLEVWKDNDLCGGVYGVALKGGFFAESKFHTVSNASKAALYYLVEYLKLRGFKLLEIQFLTPHLESLGAINISDAEYQKNLADALLCEAVFENRVRFLPLPAIRGQSPFK